MTRLTRLIGISTTVVLLGGIATASYAGTGSVLRLGHKNKASRTTVLTSKHGPALSLKGPNGKPPLAVSSTKQVKHLNASLLGGKSAAALETRAKIFTLNAHPGGVSSFAADLTGLRHGATYQISYSVDLNTTGDLLCYVAQGTADNYDLLGYGVTQGGFATDSVTGVAQVPAHADLNLYCSSGAPIEIPDSPTSDKTVVVATLIDSATRTQVTAVTH